MWASNPDPVALREDSVGIQLETTPRKIQERNDTGYVVSLNQDWLEQLELAEQSAATLHSVNMAVKPVIVQHPAIIIQPQGVLEE